MGGGIFSKNRDYQRKLLVIFSLLAILFIGKEIIESGHLLFCIFWLIIGIGLYHAYEFIQKKKLSKPASLGKVYSKKYPIIIQYAPPKGIGPAEAGLLYNCSVEPTDLTSLIYQWKFEKLIDIKTFTGENSKKEYIKLIKKGDLPLTRPLFESEIFDSIFRLGNVKIIEGAFQLRYALMLEDLEYHGVQKGWLKTGGKIDKKNKYKPTKLNKYNILASEFRDMALWFGFYLFISVLSMILDNLGGINFSGFMRTCVILFFIFFCGFLYYGKSFEGGKLKFTEKGAELASKVIGYSMFIKSCDENKIKLLLKEDPLFIDRTLPYATAFGMETEFLNKISPLKKDWNAKYFRGNKVPTRTGIFSFLFKSDDGSRL